MRPVNNLKLLGLMVLSGVAMALGVKYAPTPQAPQLPASDSSFEGLTVIGSGGAFTKPQEQYTFSKDGSPIVEATVDCASRFVRIEKMGAGTDKEGHHLSQFHETKYDVTTGKYQGRTSKGYWTELGNGMPTIVTDGLFASDHLVPAAMLCIDMTPIDPGTVPSAQIMQMAGLTK